MLVCCWPPFMDGSHLGLDEPDRRPSMPNGMETQLSFLGAQCSPTWGCRSLTHSQGMEQLCCRYSSALFNNFGQEEREEIFSWWNISRKTQMQSSFCVFAELSYQQGYLLEKLTVLSILIFNPLSIHLCLSHLTLKKPPTKQQTTSLPFLPWDFSVCLCWTCLSPRLLCLQWTLLTNSMVQKSLIFVTKAFSVRRLVGSRI